MNDPHHPDSVRDDAKDDAVSLHQQMAVFVLARDFLRNFGAALGRPPEGLHRLSEFAEKPCCSLGIVFGKIGENSREIPFGRRQDANLIVDATWQTR